MVEQYYGSNKSMDEANLADITFGHRFVAGQQQLEYLLEFLNVFVGVNGGSLDLSLVTVGYQRRLRMGLRRFVFGVGEGEKAPDEIYSGDVAALQALKEKLRTKLDVPGYSRTDEDPLEVLRNLFRSLTGVEKKRSWYAKSLFPVSESVLWWEGLRPKAQAKKQWESWMDPDAGFNMGARNFFARGGEMVYLMLAVGCKDNPALRTRLEQGLQRMLSQHKTLGQLASVIEAAWQEVRVERQWAGPGMQNREDKSGPQDFGYLWAGQESFFHQLAVDVDNLLRGRMDALEQIEGLMHLISFYVVLYFYRRAAFVTQRGVDNPVTIFVDALERPGVLRQVSTQSFQRNHEHLTGAAEEIVIRRVLEVTQAGQLDPAQVSEAALPEMKGFWRKQGFPLYRPDTKVSARVDGILRRVGASVGAAEVAMVETVFAFIMGKQERDFRKHFLSAHLNLAKKMRLVVPGTGTNQRYALNGGLLKALVLAAVPMEEKQVEFTDFVQRLFDRYGIVIGPDQVRQAATWLREVDVNHQYYQENLDAFRLRLRTAGLLKEYSDATALVVNKAAWAKGDR